MTTPAHRPATGGRTPPSTRAGAYRSRPTVARFLLVAGVLAAAALPALALDTYRIASSSMAPALQPGDRVAINTLAYHADHIRPGDLIAFTDPEHPGQVAIKRVVAMPGDTIAIYAGTLFVNHRRQREPYLGHPATGGGYFGPTTVPQGHVFVLGDNRVNSVDSRFSGPLPTGRILGHVAARLWPPHRVGPLN
jgi:signal peptidase I